MLADTARWKLVDVKFVIVGDFAGQLCPIADRWKDAAEQNSIQDSDLLHGLVKGHKFTSEPAVGAQRISHTSS